MLSLSPSPAGALALLEQRHSCQEAAQDLSEGGGVDEEEDHDEAVWEAVSELLTTLPKALGERWTPHLERLLPALLPYLREAHPLSDHALAIGILAEGLNHVEASVRACTRAPASRASSLAPALHSPPPLPDLPLTRPPCRRGATTSPPSCRTRLAAPPRPTPPAARTASSASACSARTAARPRWRRCSPS